MAKISIASSKWPLVEVGRVVVLSEGEDDGRIAAIIEIIDHKRVRVWDT